MRCPSCGFENPEGMNFCGRCGTQLSPRCPHCDFENPPGFAFCGKCGASLAEPTPAARSPSLTGTTPRLRTSTPGHLAEKILHSRATLEGERKQVTVLFADLKGSMELLADRDPEEARQLLDPVLEHMMAAVHRYEGTVNQVMGDGIMALFGAPIAHEDHAVRACYAARTRSNAWPTMPCGERYGTRPLSIVGRPGRRPWSARRRAKPWGVMNRPWRPRGHLPEHRELREQAIDLRCDLYSAHLVLEQFEHILHHLHAAETLAEALDDPRRLGRVSVHMAHYFLNTGLYDRALASSQRALTMAAAGEDHDTPIEANNFLGLVYFLQGDYRQAIDVNRRGMAALEGERRYERLGQPLLPAVRCRTYLSLCLAEAGAFAEGIAVGEEGLHIAEAVQHPVSLVSAYRSVGLQYVGQGDLHQALPLLERAAGLCEDADLPFYFSLLAPVLGAAYVLCGRADEAVRLLEQVLEQATSSGRMGVPAPLLFTLGEAHLRAGRLEEAHTLAARALEHARTYQQRGHEAYALRLLGDIATYCDPPEVEEADASYRQALALADELGMRPLVAHCHLGLGSLYAKMGQREQARAELFAAIDLYRAMDMTFWLPQAEAALAQVEGR